MNDPPSAVNESDIDIFVLSISETVASMVTENLEKKGYRVTFFTDGNYLLESLRRGKPNLLICDTTTLGEEGFEVCRQIKADEDLWVIPVLILTGASTISDLLQVLDCNADNFMPYPMDLSYCLSVIESMLGTPVERQTPDQIKTQFKISHDDRIYVVAANRRKLLEFLLSSFEIAANKSSELSHIKTEHKALSESALHFEERFTEQTRFINSANAALREKEHKIITFTGELEEKEQFLAQKTEEIDKLVRELEENKALLATYEENLRSIVQEIKDIEISHGSELATLMQQISELSAELDTAKTILETVRTELDEEKIHGTSLECTIELLVPQKELVEKVLHTVTGELEQLKSALAIEKSRATSAEQEIEAIVLAKTQSEQGLTQKIDSLSETAQQQNQDLTRLKNELEAEANLRISAENQAGTLRLDKEQLESSLRSAMDDLSRQLRELQTQYESASAALEHEKTITTSLREDLADAVADREKSEEQVKTDLDSNKTALAELKNDLDAAVAARTALERDLDAAKAETRASEEKLNLASQTGEQSGQQVHALTDELEQVKAALAGLKNDLDAAVAARTALERDLDAAKAETRASEEKLNLASQTEEQSSHQMKVLADELEQVKAALEHERDLITSLRQDLTEAVAEKENTEELVKTDLDSYKVTFIKLKRDLDEAIATRTTLEKEIEFVKIQDKAYKNELNLASQGREQSEIQVRSLIEELEKVKAAFESERSLHQTSDESLEGVVQTMERVELDLQRAVDERDKLNEFLKNEEKLRLAAEEKTRVVVQEHEQLEKEFHAVTDEQQRQEHDRAEKIQNLKKDLESLCDLQNSLENQVTILTEEKLQAEQKVQALTTELDLARTALANEWEDHMTSDEQLAAAVEERERLEQSFSQAVIPKEPEPLTISEPAPLSLAVVPPHEIQPSPVPESEESSGEVSPDLPFAPSEMVEDATGISEADKRISDTIGEEPEEEKTDTVPDETGEMMPAGMFSINRMQWFDLLKWAHHSKDISHDQRLQIVRMGRLIQKDRKLTRKQEDQVRELIVLVQALGYRPS